MKKFLLILAALAVIVPASAQGLKLADGIHYGVVGGFTSSSTNIKNFSPKHIALYHVGITAKFNLGIGFAIQPSLMYQVKGARLSDIELGDDFVHQFDYKLGYLELPVNIQWGPDLMAFRPYVFVEPFIGYAVNNDLIEKIKSEDLGDYTPAKAKNAWKEYGLKRFEYGLGLGAGFEFWRMQLSAQWFWNFGNLYDSDSDSVSGNAIAYNIKHAFTDKKNFQGVKISLAILF
ncbi:MAG: PorT family protein [Bacteroidales bacterium]|nr:PorT family protein [Bacteroidales bacterium]